MKKTLLTLMLALSGAAQAHFVWLEPAGNGEARAYFGEWADDLRETEATYLKLVSTPKAVDSEGKETLATRHPDHFAIKTGSGDARIVGGYVNKEGVISLYQAKAGRSETTARMPLELVPSAANASTFTLLLRGKPLAKTEVTVFGPPKWQKNLRTDDAGKVTVPTPWSGTYVLEVGHVEKDAAGTWDGKDYKSTRHVATLSFSAP